MPQRIINVVYDLTPLPAIPATGEPFGFTLSAQIIDAALSSASTTKTQTARLKANGAIIPIEDFTLSHTSEYADKELSGTLAAWDYNLIAASDSIDFEIGTRDAPNDSILWIKEIEGGFLASKSRTESLANRQLNDRVRFVIRDSLAARYSKAPNVPTIYYNPSTTDAPVITDTTQLPVDESGAPIVPVIIADANLTLLRALELAYVDGLGFDSVSVNIDDYALESPLEFSLEGGYDGAVRNLLSILKPDFQVRGNDLIIKVLGRGASGGGELRAVFARDVTSFAQSTPPHEKIDRLKITYQSRAGEIMTERTETDPAIEDIPFGEPGFTSIRNIRRVREWKRADNPGVIVKTLVFQTETITEDAAFNVINHKVQTDDYNSKGLKKGHVKTETKLLPTIEAGVFESQLALTEIETNTYRPNPFNPTQVVLERTTKFQNGLILEEPDVEYKYPDGSSGPRRTPIIEARASDYIQYGSSQTLVYDSIRKFVTEPRIVSQDQVEWRESVFNFCTGDHESDRSQVMPGSTAFDNNGGANARSIYIGSSGATSRKTAEFNAGELPFNLALEIGRQYLLDLNSPPDSFGLELDAYDPLVNKADDVTVYDRAGFVAVARVTGRTVTGQNGFIRESLTLKEINGDAPTVAQPSAPINPFAIIINESTSETFATTIKCYDGYQLRAEANSLLTIEARATGSGSAFVNIQTTPIDLGAAEFVNQSVSFDFRVTAAAISTPLERTDCRVIVELAP